MVDKDLEKAKEVEYLVMVKNLEYEAALRVAKEKYKNNSKGEFYEKKEDTKKQ